MFSETNKKSNFFKKRQRVDNINNDNNQKQGESRASKKRKKLKKKKEKLLNNEKNNEKNDEKNDKIMKTINNNNEKKSLNNNNITDKYDPFNDKYEDNPKIPYVYDLDNYLNMNKKDMNLLQKPLIPLHWEDILEQEQITSKLKSRQLFKWMIWPLSVETFYKYYFEKKPFLIKNRIKFLKYISDKLQNELKNNNNNNNNNNNDIDDDDEDDDDDDDDDDDINNNINNNNNNTNNNNNNNDNDDDDDESENDINVLDSYQDFFNKNEISEWLRTQSMIHGVDIDVTHCKNGIRYTYNPYTKKLDKAGHFDKPLNYMELKEPIATLKEIIDLTKNKGCSIRLYCPQKYSDKIYAILSSLEDEFECMVGSNAYLTPFNHQGFAPHYDDIDAFLLQLEGSKYWKVYSPLDDINILPRFPSNNYTPDDMLNAKLLFEGYLEEGDLLYLPRGFIHQGVNNNINNNKSSLHLTISTNQSNSYADFLEFLLPESLGTLIKNNIKVRQTIPSGLFEYLGATNSDLDEYYEEYKNKININNNDNDPVIKALYYRNEFKKKIKEFLLNLMNESMNIIDAGVDQWCKRYISDRLPPFLHPNQEDNLIQNNPNAVINAMTKLRVIRPNVARLVIEDNKAIIYHCIDNSRIHHGNPLSPLEFELDDGPALETLINAYPEGVFVNELPHPPIEDIDDKIAIANSLYHEGLLEILI